MTLDEMFERVITLSGQFLLRKENIELDVDRFRHIVESCLGDWNAVKQLRGVLTVSNSSNQHTFIEECHENGIPDGIIKIVPIRIFGLTSSLSSNHLFSSFNTNGWSRNSWLEEKQPFPFIYRKPTLHLYIESEVEVHARWDYKMIKRVENGNSFWDVPGIRSKDVTFFELLRARFMYALGRQRNAFTMQDLPITMDAQDLISEGLQLEERALERLHQKDKQWYLSWGG